MWLTKCFRVFLEMLLIEHPDAVDQYVGVLGTWAPCEIGGGGWGEALSRATVAVGGLRRGEVAYGVVLGWAWMRNVPFGFETSANGESYPMPRFQKPPMTEGSDWYLIAEDAVFGIKQLLEGLGYPIRWRRAWPLAAFTLAAFT